jgi:hypothetical protein
MTDTQYGLVIRPEDAEPYVLNSLNRGTALAELVARELWRTGEALLLAPSNSVKESPLERGQGLATAVADEFAVRFLRRAEDGGGRSLVVESDLARRGDPHLDADVAYIGNRVLRWVDMPDDPSHGTRLLRSGASGYPLNAFVCDRSSAELGLFPGADLTETTQSRIAGSVRAIIVSALDAETFLVWLRPSALADTLPLAR